MIKIDNINKNESKIETNNINNTYIKESKILEILDSLKPEQVISYISNYIVNLLIKNIDKTKININGINDPLYSNKIPMIKIEDYFIRLYKYSHMDLTTLILSFIYIKRFIDKENFIIAFNNIFRLIISCTLLAIKFNENRIFKNIIYAKIGGLEIEDLNNLEFNVFNRLDFNLNVFDNEFYGIISKIHNDNLNNT